MARTPIHAARPVDNFMRQRLSLRQLHILAAVGDSGSLSAAADRLGLTQPAVSKSLAELESGFGQALFVRHGRGVRATPVGERLIAMARRVQAELLRGRGELEAWQQGVSGRLQVGATSAALARVVPQAIAASKADWPTLAISVVTAPLAALLEAARVGRLDLVVGRRRESEVPPGLRMQLLARVRHRVVISLSHALAQRRALDWDQLADQAWIWPPYGTRTRLLQQQLWQRLGVALPENVVETSDIALIHALFARLPLLAVLDDDAAQGAVRAGVARILPLEVSLGFVELCAWHATAPGAAAVEAFVHRLRDAVERPTDR
jgi:DNA-binding transcriptional LysR family regulator